jgi:hypothetical protein
MRFLSAGARFGCRARLKPSIARTRQSSRCDSCRCGGQAPARKKLRTRNKREIGTIDRLADEAPEARSKGATPGRHFWDAAFPGSALWRPACAEVNRRPQLRFAVPIT